MNEDSTIIFPTTYKQLPLISLSKSYFPGMDLVPVTFNGYYNTQNKDVAGLDNRHSLNVQYYPEPDCNFNVKNLVLTSGTGSNENIKETASVASKILQANKNKTNIWSCLTTKDEQKLSEFEGFPFEELNAFNSPAKQIINGFLDGFTFEKFIGRELYSPAIPVIAVGSVMGFNNQSEITAQISLELKDYGAAAIVNSNDYTIINCFPMLDAIIDNKYTIVEKVILINQYIKYIVELSRCNVLVIEIPGGLLRLNNSCLNDLGQFAYILSQAVDVDYFICCSSCNSFSKDYYENIFKYVADKYNFETIALHISNCFLDFQSIGSTQQERFVFKSLDTVYRQIDNLLLDGSFNHIYNLLDRNHLTIFLKSLFE